YDTQFKLQPRLATSWQVSGDGTTWTFNLRKGVTFHDGTPFDAAAVKANFDRWIDPKGQSYSAGIFHQTLDSLEVVDPSTIRIRTKGPTALMPGAVGIIGSELISPKQLQNPDSIKTQPVGTGAFKVDSFVPAENLTLMRNDGYWGDKALLDRANFKFIAEPSAQSAALSTGQVDLALNFPDTQLDAIAG